MGSRVAVLAAHDERFKLTACLYHKKIGPSVGARALGQDQAQTALEGCDAVIIFSPPEAAALLAAQSAKIGIKVIVGTTGLSKEQMGRLVAASSKAAVFYSANFSPSVAVMTYLCAEAARLLPSSDVGISETHHRLKKDAPSGTALQLAQSMSKAGIKDAPIVSQRIGDVVGDHTVTLAGISERLEITHRAQSRDLFARGALEAALWLRGKKPGFYGMADLLGLQ
jgi:4-hydroxy-tetrahydrodipicolinate reductase